MCSLVCTNTNFPIRTRSLTRLTHFFIVFNLCLYMSNLMNCQIKVLLTKRFGLHIGNVYIGWPVAYLEGVRGVHANPSLGPNYLILWGNVWEKSIKM